MSSFRFRKKTEYGLMMMTLLAIAGKGKLVSVRAMQELGLPRSFLIKIARDLIKAKMVVAKEGRGGGYGLAKNAKTISLKQIVSAIEGEVATTMCLIHGGKKCPMEKNCSHREMMVKLSVDINGVLESYKLSDFGGK